MQKHFTKLLIKDICHRSLSKPFSTHHLTIIMLLVYTCNHISLLSIVSEQDTKPVSKNMQVLAELLLKTFLDEPLLIEMEEALLWPNINWNRLIIS